MDTQLTDRQIERRRKRRGIVALLGAVSILTIGAGSISLAQFTDTDSSAWDFATGTIDVNSNSALMTAVSAMMPGDQETQALTISNDGSGDLRYTLSVAATDALGSALELTVNEEDAGGGCAAFDGATVLAATALDGAAVGDATQGADAGDRDLAAGASEVLCFRVSLPLSAGDALQGATSAATFSFAAEQTANNP
jgi:spore coat-associated protein N